MICRRCLVSGRVQGVWYRDTTRRKARELGLSGIARNLADGRVEVIVQGPEGSVTALCEWLWVGPSMARVDDVRCQAASATPMQGFTIG